MDVHSPQFGAINTNNNSSLSPPPPTPERECAPQQSISYSSQQPAFGALGALPVTQLNDHASTSIKPEEGAAPAPKKRAPAKPRKPKEPVDPNAPVQTGDVKPKKPRKPRDPNAPPIKRRKKNSDEPSANVAATTLPASVPVTANDAAPPPSTLGFGPTTNTQVTGSYAANPPPTLPNTNGTSQPATSQAPGRAQSTRYDPIRSASLENARLASTPTPTPSASVYHSPTQPLASPTIARVIDNSKAAMPTTVRDLTPTPRPSVTEAKRKTPPKLAPAPKTAPTPTLAPASASPGLATQDDGAKDKSGPKPSNKAAAKEKPESRQPSPKPPPPPPHRKKLPPPQPLSTGLLAGADFGKKPESKQYAQVSNDCIVIDVPINGRTNNYVNFLKEVENKYGFDVAHPRIADHRRRMAQMAAAGAAIESTVGTADDMSLDISSLEDSDVEMGGVNGNAEESGNGTDTKRKKITRSDRYDLADDFIDDTEQAWAEQALASKDGYFVWSGPLIQEGDIPSVERADGTVKRGRGRGRGGARGAAGARGGKADTGEKKSTRGTGATRKPRAKKAEKQEADNDKEREKTVAATSTVTNGTVGTVVVGAAA